MNRREFLQGLATSSSVLALYGCGGGGGSGGSNPVTAPQPPSAGDSPGQVLERGRPVQTVVIIGAGIAGLVAGYELSQVGHEVIILEARERNGGRVNTFFSPFGEGQFTEAGASRIPSNHNLTLDYINHFGLTLETFYPTSSDFFLLGNNQVQRIAAAQYNNQPPFPGSVNRSAYRKIVGGMSELPNALANTLSSNIIYSAPVVRIEQNSINATITTASDDVYVADRVLCTTPIPVLGNIDFEPALSSAKRTAAAGDYDYTDSNRLYTQFSERFWLDNNFNGWGDSNLNEEIWQPTWNQSGSGGILQSYLRGTTAEVFDSLSTDQQIASVHNRWRQVFPNLDNFILTSHVFSWQDEIWTGSAYASPTSAQQTTLKAALSEIEGRIHFAGEHASNFEGWIQGALESGIRAAREINQAA